MEFLKKLHFTSHELKWLRGSGMFSAGFLDTLAKLRFTGDVDAMPEGTAFFPTSPCCA